LSGGVRMACVVVRSAVMGGAGSDLARRLLNRGVHVIQEAPVHHDDLADCLREARPRGVLYRVSDLYVRLPAVRRFIAAARALRLEQAPVYVDAACAIQVAFPLLHILGEALGAVRPWRVHAPARSGDAPWSILTGVIGGVPFSLRVHNQVDPEDPDNHLPLLHRVTIGLAGGSLTLTDTHGPVIWSPRLHIPDAVKQRLDFAGDGTAHLAEPSSIALGPWQPPSYRRILGELWPRAIGQELLAFRRAIMGGEERAARPEQYQLTLCQMWQDLTAQLGYPSTRASQSHRPLSVDPLLATVAGIDEDNPRTPPSLTSGVS
ncbi:MAG TPA: Gfo/Idh/MocA family oxidoreductase, partial [Polyangiaceae bacterium]